MGKIVEVPFKSGTILFEAREADGAQAFTTDSVVERAQESLESAVDTVRDVAEAFVEKLSGLRFTSAEVTLGIKIAGKGRFIVAEASAEASLTVKISLAPQA